MTQPSDRPFVLINMAMSSDGKIATANRAIASFGSRRDRAHLLELRATADAVLCGAGTANVPGTTLGPGGIRHRRQRRRRGLAEFNLRIVVSGRAALRPDADVFRERRSPILVLVSPQASPARVARLRRVAADVRAFGKHELDLAAALRWLLHTHGVRRLVCEGGAELNDAMLRAGLVDEIHLTLCPVLLGGARAPTLSEGLGVPRLDAACQLALHRAHRVGDELFLVYRVTRSIPRE